MSAYYSSEKLIESVKRRISLPLSQSTFTEADVLAFADEEMSLAVVPLMISFHEDHLLFSEDVPLEAGKTEYYIPYRAIGNKLYDVQYIDNGGNLFELTRSSLGNPHMANSMNSGITSFYVKNNRIGLLPQNAQSSEGSLRFIYYIRPSTLVLTPAVGVISAINRTTGVITLSSTPTSFTVGKKFDFYKTQSPHSILSIDLTATTLTSTTITFALADIPENLMVGDHVSLSEECAIPQIPSDLHVHLAQKTAERILEAQGDLEGLKMAQAKSSEMEHRAGTIIDNRVEEAPVKINSNSTLLKSGLRRRFRR